MLTQVFNGHNTIVLLNQGHELCGSFCTIRQKEMSEVPKQHKDVVDWWALSL